MQNIEKYVNEGNARFIEELKELLRIQSISTLEDHKPEMQKCAEFVAAKLKDAGIPKVTIYKTKGHPIVYGEWKGAPGKPTVLIYGHYDVQPVDPIELWKTPPFEPTVVGNKIFARGATDDKGQMYIHIKSIESILKTNGTLPVNVKFLIEGEEEIGSPSLAPFIKENKELLKCDSVLISDTSLFAPGQPTITYGLRGLCYMQIEVTGPDRDLHSGTYGGGVPNPINVIAGMVAKLHDKNGKITIPGFYDKVVKLTAQERKNFKALNFSEKKWAAEIGLKELQGEAGYTTLERIWARPTLDCNGIWGGFTGQGAKTVIPSKAYAKISMRLVPNQNPKEIEKLFTAYIKQIAPKSVKVNITSLHGGDGVLAPLTSKAVQAGAAAMQRAFGKKTVFMREGGSIPVVAVFDKVLKAPAVLMGFGLNTENLHSPNEHFDLNHFRLGIISSAYFLEEFSK